MACDRLKIPCTVFLPRSGASRKMPISQIGPYVTVEISGVNFAAADNVARGMRTIVNQ